jgi:hypothetical protein
MDYERGEIGRYKQFYNPIFKYDYKAGDFFPKIFRTLHSHLYPTITHLSGAQHSL